MKDTKIELAVQGWLALRGIPFTKHGRIPGIRHEWDIMIESRRVLVEVDGCRWHGCPDHPGSWGDMRKKAQANIKRDQRLDEEARKQGWTVVRIWEHHINCGDFQALEEALE